MRFKIGLLTLFGLLFSALAHAQSPITLVTFKVYVQGATTPIQTPTVMAITNFVCNTTKPTDPTSVQVNPTKIYFDDIVNTGKVCLYTDPGTGVLFSVPFGTQVYEARVSATNSGGTSPDSLVSNSFSHPGAPPTAPTGLKVSGI